MRPIAPPRRAIDVGDVIEERWTIDDVIGEGGMAVVYAATHRNGSRVALKLLREELAYDAALVNRFFAEGRLANLISHRGVVRSLDDGTTANGVPYLVLELLEGRSLEQMLNCDGPLSLDDAAHVMTEVLSVLGVAHAQGIVHRDVKPENVLVTSTGQVKLLDFGIARSPAHHMKGMNHTHTASGTILGTPAFMAPEQARGRWEQIDGRTDLFSVAATMYRAITQSYLRHEDTVMEELGAAMAPLRPMREIAPTFPKVLADWFDRALAYDREARFATAAEMIEALNDARTEPLPLMRMRSTPHIEVFAPSEAHLTIPPQLSYDVLPSRSRFGYVAAALAMVATMATSVFLTLTAPHAPAPRSSASSYVPASSSLPNLQMATSAPSVQPADVAAPVPAETHVMQVEQLEPAPAISSNATPSAKPARSAGAARPHRSQAKRETAPETERDPLESRL